MFGKLSSRLPCLVAQNAGNPSFEKEEMRIDQTYNSIEDTRDIKQKKTT